METLGEVPSESTFSRAFGQFSSDNRPQTIHAALIKTHDGEKIAGHISRDATAIHAREKAVAKARPEEKTKSKPGAESNGGKRGRRRKDDPPAPSPEPKRLQQQLERDLEANLADLPRSATGDARRTAISTTWPTPRTTPSKSVKCQHAWGMCRSSTTTRGEARSASSRPPKPCATASAARSKGATPICTNNTGDGMYMSEARLKWPHT